MPWWMGTFFYFSKFLDEDRCFLEFSIKGMETFLKLSEGWKQRNPEALEKRRVDLSIVNRENGHGFPGLHARHTVSLWNMLDVTLSESLVQLFIADSAALELPAFDKLKFSVAQYRDMSRTQLMRFAVTELKQHYSSPYRFNKGVRVYERIYKELGIESNIPKEIDKLLIELRAMRNVIVHNMAIADERLVQVCPWLKLEVNAPAIVTAPQYREYKNASLSYVAAILMAFRNKFDKK